jgi:adenine phosphoribosyltransferase
MTVRLQAEDLIRDVPDWPIPGVVFKDLTPVMRDPKAMEEAVAAMADEAKRMGANVILGIDARGFIFGGIVADRLGLPFVPVRKKGKLPWQTVGEEYALEYGTATVEMHIDAVDETSRVVIVDDLLATGGTSEASAKLVERLGAKVVGMVFLVELEFLHGRDKLDGYDVTSFIRY